MAADELEVSNDTRTDEDLDKLADSASNARNSDRAMKDTPAPEPEKAAPEEYEIKVGQKTVKATREQVIKWAQQGYNYPQLAQGLNQEKAKLAQQQKDWEQKWGVYKQIDEYAQQNADWWNFIQQNWQTRGQQPPQGAPSQTAPIDAYAPKFQELEQKLNSKVEPVLTYIQEIQKREEDSKLDTEIQSIREKHKDLDWDGIDENGKSLELRVLEHAQQNGIPTFKAAFRDLLHDDLLAKASAQAKVDVSKGIQARTKLGVLGESPTSKSWSAPTRNKDIKNTSYEEIEAEIRNELRTGRR